MRWSWRHPPGLEVGGTFDRLTDPEVGPAAAQVPRHGRTDVGVGGPRLALQQRRGAEQLAGLAVPALRYVQLQPRLLDRMVLPVPGQAFNGGDLAVLHRRDRYATGAGRGALHQHGAGAAERLAATELGAGEADEIPERPEQRHGGWGRHVVGGPVDDELHDPPGSAEGSSLAESAPRWQRIRRDA